MLLLLLTIIVVLLRLQSRQKTVNWVWLNVIQTITETNIIKNKTKKYTQMSRYIMRQNRTDNYKKSIILPLKYIVFQIDCVVQWIALITKIVFRLGKFSVRISYNSYIIIQDDRLAENYRDSLQSHTTLSFLGEITQLGESCLNKITPAVAPPTISSCNYFRACAEMQQLWFYSQPLDVVHVLQ